MAAGSDLPKMEVTSRAQLRAWLEAHHATSGSIWLVTRKKHNPDRHVPYVAIVEEALCFGWVDSLPRKLDTNHTLTLGPMNPGFTRRSNGWRCPSIWQEAQNSQIANIVDRIAQVVGHFRR